MTNEEKIKQADLHDLLMKINYNITNGTGCVLDAIDCEMYPCKPAIGCDECISKWLKAEKGDLSWIK